MKRYIQATKAKTYDNNGFQKAITALFDAALEKSPFQGYKIWDIDIERRDTHPVSFRATISYSFEGGKTGPSWGRPNSKELRLDIPSSVDIPEDYYITNDRIDYMLEDVIEDSEADRYVADLQDALARFTSDSRVLARKYGFKISKPKAYPNAESFVEHYSDYYKRYGIVFYFLLAGVAGQNAYQDNVYNTLFYINFDGNEYWYKPSEFRIDVMLEDLKTVDFRTPVEKFFQETKSAITKLQQDYKNINNYLDAVENLVDTLNTKYPDAVFSYDNLRMEEDHRIDHILNRIPSVTLDVEIPSMGKESELTIKDVFHLNMSDLHKKVRSRFRDRSKKSW